MTAVLDAIDGKQLLVCIHPAYVAASAQCRDLAGFEANGLFFGEVIKGKEGMLSFLSPSVALRTPSNGCSSRPRDYISRRARSWPLGLPGKSLLTDVRFEAPEPWHCSARCSTLAGLRKDRLSHNTPKARGRSRSAHSGSRVERGARSHQGQASPDYRPIVGAMEKAMPGHDHWIFLCDELFRVIPVRHGASSPSATAANGSADPAFLI